MKPGDLVRFGRSAGSHLHGEFGILLVVHNNPGDDALPDGWRWCDVLHRDEVQADLFMNDLIPVTYNEGD